jgi:hypothetical protein
MWVFRETEKFLGNDNLWFEGQVIYAAYRKLFRSDGAFEAFQVFSRQLLLASLSA